MVDFFMTEIWPLVLFLWPYIKLPVLFIVIIVPTSMRLNVGLARSATSPIQTPFVDNDLGLCFFQV